LLADKPILHPKPVVGKLLPVKQMAEPILKLGIILRIIDYF
jgi:hypothetical protein